MEEKRQGRTTHAYRLVRRYGEPIRTQAEVEAFVEWMSSEGLAASTQATILSTIRSVQPKNKALGSVVIKVPTRSVQEEVLSKDEIKRVLADLRQNEAWYYPCFALWLGTGLRNAELIGLTWDCVRLDEGELADQQEPEARWRGNSPETLGQHQDRQKQGGANQSGAGAAAESTSAADEGVGAGYQDRLGVPDASNPSAPV